MREIILNINEIKIEDFDAPNLKAKFSVVYSVNNEKKVRTILVNLKDKIENIVEEILKIVKSSVSVDVDGDDFVGSLFVKRLFNEEKVEGKMHNYFAKTCDRLRGLKNEKNHSEYMKLYHELKGSGLIL